MQLVRNKAIVRGYIAHLKRESRAEVCAAKTALVKGALSRIRETRKEGPDNADAEIAASRPEITQDRGGRFVALITSMAWSSH